MPDEPPSPKGAITQWLLDRGRLAATGHTSSPPLWSTRFFGGLTIEESAEVLGISGATVERESAFARAWLYDAIEGSEE